MDFNKILRHGLVAAVSLVTLGQLSGCDLASNNIQFFHDQLHDDDSNIAAAASLDNSSVITENFQVVLADGVVPISLGNDSQGAFIFAGPDQNKRSITELAEKELAGFIQQVSSINNNAIGSMTSSEEILDNIMGEINNVHQSASAIFRSSASEFYSSGSFLIRTSLPTNNISLAQSIANIVSPSLLGNSTVAQFAAEQPSDLSSTEFRLSISISFELNDVAVLSDDRSVASVEQAPATMIIFTIVNNAIFNAYEERTANIIDESNVISPDASIIAHTDTYTAIASEAFLADFLFVIDNSGSMEDEQLALVEAASVFVDEITKTGLSYQFGIITTDNSYLVDPTNHAYEVNNYRSANGSFFSDVEILKNRIEAINTSGSGFERGIAMAELALLPEDNNNPSQGTVLQAGYPRRNASMSVIIMSDEPSQYPGIFDVENNLFVDQGIRVYGILSPDENLYFSQYSDLSDTTGGVFGDISDTSSFPDIMKAVATNAGGLTSPYVLNKNPIGSTIDVSVDNVSIQRDANGWRYSPRSNSIFFSGDSVPVKGQRISVVYQADTP